MRATSQDGSFTTANYLISLTDANEGSVGSVSDANAAANAVLENSGNGTVVGITGLATDPDGTDTITYSLDDSAGGRFTINASTGVVTVNGAIDREAADQYDITIRATSSDTSFSVQTFTITIGDVDEFNVGSVTTAMQQPTPSMRTLRLALLSGITASAMMQTQRQCDHLQLVR